MHTAAYTWGILYLCVWMCSVYKISRFFCTCTHQGIPITYTRAKTSRRIRINGRRTEPSLSLSLFLSFFSFIILPYVRREGSFAESTRQVSIRCSPRERERTDFYNMVRLYGYKVCYGMDLAHAFVGYIYYKVENRELRALFHVCICKVQQGVCIKLSLEWCWN